MYKSFDLNEFWKEMESGDLSGLKYLEKTIIREMREKTNKSIVENFTKEEYIISLFYATLNLNSCNNIYEMERNVETNFNYDIYAIVRDKLLEELGLN